MNELGNRHARPLAKQVGWSLLAMILIGITASIFLTPGIDINLTADVSATAENMLQAEQRLRANAYVGVLGLCLDVFFSIGLFFLLRKHGRILASWCLAASLIATTLVLFGSVFAMNAAEIASDPAYRTLANDAQRLLLSGFQATSDYTSFHISIVISSLAKAGFFYLFFASRSIPRSISGWGLFASLFVALTIVARDFVPALGNIVITMSFMLANLIALVALAVYLSIWGVRIDGEPS